MNKNNVCNNCNKSGHLLHNCKLPITSYGIILFRKINNCPIQFLMIRRKDTFGYIDFIRGKYCPYNINQFQTIVNEMSQPEKERILSHSFDDLWKLMWGKNINSQFNNEEISSGKKFEIINCGKLCTDVNNCDTPININYFVNNSTTNWKETEWEFPKGRRNYQEKDLDCALREFEEETGILNKNIKVIENVLPFEETFIGTNHKSYKHKYFLAYLTTPESSVLNYQPSEVSKMEWKTIDECLQCIRPYNLEKKQLIVNINKLLQEYTLYY